MNEAGLRGLIRDVPDFPEEGILFRDVTPLLADPAALAAAVEQIAAPFRNEGIELVLGIESRGFILGPAVALSLGAGFGLVRKPGKLPCETHGVDYQLEYGSDRLEMHVDAVGRDQRLLIVDDLLATGGTAAAALALARKAGADVLGAAFLIELEALGGRKQLDLARIHAVIRY